jgi:hypothetical protein
MEARVVWETPVVPFKARRVSAVPMTSPVGQPRQPAPEMPAPVVVAAVPAAVPAGAVEPELLLPLVVAHWLPDPAAPGAMEEPTVKRRRPSTTRARSAEAMAMQATRAGPAAPAPTAEAAAVAVLVAMAWF